MTSASSSGSFSSSQAIVAHFEEVAVPLIEGGFSLSEEALDSIVRALRDEVLGEVEFWGVDPVDGEGRALLTLTFDWSKHQLTVGSGDTLDLPVKDGKIHLFALRRAAKSLLFAISEKGLSTKVLLSYDSAHEGRAEQLDRKYGWRDALPIERHGSGKGFRHASPYYSAVVYGQWYSDDD